MSQVEWARVNVGDNIQNAINSLALANGGVVYLVPGEHTVSATLELPYPWQSIPPDTTPPVRPVDWQYNPLKPIALLGDGANATTIKCASGFAGPLFRVGRPFSSISGITFDGAGLTLGATVEIAGTFLSGKIADTRRISFRDCIIKNGKVQCLKISGGPGLPISTLNSFERCVFTSNGSGALVEIQEGVIAQEFRNCTFASFKGYGVLLVQCEGASFYDCLFDSAAEYGSLEAFLLSNQSRYCQVFNCVFDEGSTPTSPPDDPSVIGRRWFIDLFSDVAPARGSNGWTIAGCQFIRRSAANANAQAIRVGRTGPSWGVVVIDPVIRMPAEIAPAIPGLQIDIQNPVVPLNYDELTQCVVVGGMCEVGDPPGSTKHPFDLTTSDASLKTAWIGHRRWRIPQSPTSQNPSLSTLRAGDLLSRPSRSLEAFSEAKAGVPGSAASWIPMTVNRYTDLAALNGVTTQSINLGALAWVDSPGELRVCTNLSPLTWSKVTLQP
jgi:hypothetical protein